ncbi:acyltransferase family protein [Massilia polaris]|uniref:acyltransferase family protein n=1 Tax=Massilia polaris TaxID=2728846 RepID=UPI00351D149F
MKALRYTAHKQLSAPHELDNPIAVLAPPASAGSVNLSHHPKYRPDIDGLRAIAVLAVVLFHAFPALIPGGFIGVDIFFVISGFLITSIIARELEHGKFTFARFYARRIKRIFPALLLVMAACLAFAWFALFPDELKQLGLHLAGGAGFVSNLVLWQEVGYFDRGADTKPLLHLWSLAIEEQFYIVWPVVLLLASRLRLNLLLVSAGLALLSFAVNVGGIAAFPSATFYSPASRAWELLLGAVLACSLLRTQPVVLFARAAAAVSPNLRSAAGALLLAIGFAIISREHQFPGWYALLPTVGALLMIGAGPQSWFNRFVLSNRLLVWFGLISYPLYLWHWPLLAFAHIVESGTPAPQLRAALVALAIALSTGTRTPCALPRAEVDKQTPQNEAHVASLLRDFPGVKRFRTRQLMCDDKLCWAMKDGNLLYRDNNHLSYEGDLYIGEKFAEWHASRGAKQGGNRPD